MTRLILILALASLACLAPATLAQPIPTALPTVTAIVEVEQVFTVAAWTVYIRDASGDVIQDRWLERGDVVTCELDGDWCVMDDTTRIWAGCLDPNPLGLGCKER